jgi:ribosomal protein S12 methylthiotransferase accessory factor
MVREVEPVVLLEATDLRLAKIFRCGTDRIVPPEVTVQRAWDRRRAMGITRLANVTGLDDIGLPVYMACRPNSKSLSVTQGKGATVEAAKASAIMEAVESFHAETIDLPLLVGTWRDIARRHQVPLLEELPLIKASSPDLDCPLLWIEAADWVAGEPLYVPYDMVHLDLTYQTRLGRGLFDITSNGLASGNHLVEAVNHAICELLERDAMALWFHAPPRQREESAVDLDSVDDADCRSALELLDAAKIRVRVWDTTADHGIPSYLCMISDQQQQLQELYAASGMGCHPRREVALHRALSEAIQSRLTIIAGARDDVGPADYRRLMTTRVLRAALDATTAGPAARDFRATPTHDNDLVDADRDLLLSRLRGIGVSHVGVVDLTRPDIGIPVARVIIPSLEFYINPELYSPGQRARRTREALP